MRGRGHHERDPQRRRIPRACDRCRLKKSKCDGGPLCEPCNRIDLPCVFKTRRSAEAKNYYTNLHEIVQEALQRMYWACRNGRDFPGTLPDETSGRVTTHAILEGLGLIGADDDESGFQEVPTGSLGSGVRTGDPGQQVAAQATSPSSSPSLPGEQTPASQVNPFDTHIPSSVPYIQHNIPFNDASSADLHETTEQDYLSILDNCKQLLPIDFSLQEPMLQLPKAQLLVEPLIAPSILGGQSMTSHFMDFDSANLSESSTGLMQEPMSWCTNMYPKVFDVQP